MAAVPNMIKAGLLAMIRASESRAGGGFAAGLAEASVAEERSRFSAPKSSGHCDLLDAVNSTGTA